MRLKTTKYRSLAGLGSAKASCLFFPLRAHTVLLRYSFSFHSFLFDDCYSSKFEFVLVCLTTRHCHGSHESLNSSQRREVLSWPSSIVVLSRHR